MPAKPTDAFLQRFPFFSASNVEQFAEALRSLYDARLVDVRHVRDFSAWASYLHLDDVALGFSGCSVAATIDFSESDFVRQQIATKGTAITTLPGAEVSIDREHSCTTSEGQSMRLSWQAGHERMTFRVRTTALEKKLETLLGTKPKGGLQLEAAQKLSDRRTRGLLQLIASFAKLFDSETMEPPPLVLRELEQALIVNFLLANRHPFSARLEQESPTTAPSHVRLAEEYIEAHWRNPILIDDLVAITGVSARSLFRSFQVHRDCSPMEFAKAIRLRHAREMLLDAAPNASVTAVCLACGFGNAGHFARDYRNAFGELPSETLRRVKLRS